MHFKFYRTKSVRVASIYIKIPWKAISQCGASSARYMHFNTEEEEEERHLIVMGNFKVRIWKENFIYEVAG